MENSTVSVSNLVHDVDVGQHLVQRQHLPTEHAPWPVPLLTLSALQFHTRHLQYNSMLVMREYFVCCLGRCNKRRL